jgi:hypothetical protein
LREPWRAAFILLLPLLQLEFFWGEMDLHADHTAVNWAEHILSNAPPRAILRTAEDKTTFTLWYTHDVLGKRADLIVVDRDLWEYRPYRKILVESFGVDASLENIARETQRPLIDIEANP